MTRRRDIGAVLFDLDGTLLDTAPDMAGALNALRIEEGLEPLPFMRLRPHVSHGAARLVRVGFDVDEGDRFERLRRRFLDIYRGALAVGTTPFPGIERVLAILEANSLPWGVVTNKPGWLTDPLLARLGLLQRAGVVVSGDTLAQRKPHPQPLLHAAGQLGVAPGRVAYVGDAERDIQAARAAGMPAIVAGFGYLDAADDPAAWQPDAMIDQPLDLLVWLGLQPEP